MCYIDTVKELILLTNTHNLTEIEIHHDMTRIRIKKNRVHEFKSSQVGSYDSRFQTQDFRLVEGSYQPLHPDALGESALGGLTEGIEITSPMVGTFYRALSSGSKPSAEPFDKLRGEPVEPLRSKPYIDIGAEVNPETVVCVIETMKIINEIKAGVTGKVVEVLVEDGEAVEFGQPIFRVQNI